MLSNYPPGTSATDPRAPWNQPEAPAVEEVIDQMDGEAFFDSGNWDIEGSLDAFDGRIRFSVPSLYGKRWLDLSDAERALFEQYAAVVRGFAALYEEGAEADR